MGDTSNETFPKRRKIFLDKLKEAEKVGGTKMILVIVANVLDPHIGKGCAKDIESIRQMFSSLAEHMKFWFLELVIKGEAYSKKNVEESINSIKAGSDDILVFYYTGHGFRFEKQDDVVYPHVYLQPTLPKATDAIINENSLNLNEIFESVKARGARLNIVIGDCCNNLIHFERKFSDREKKPRPEEAGDLVVFDKSKCRTLFCDLTASILVASADKGQFSITDDDIGSIFTFNFTKNLKILLSTAPGASDGFPWHKFLEESTEETFSQSKTFDIGVDKVVQGHQKPIFKVFTV